jgi:cell division transport system ATP-binding protein
VLFSNEDLSKIKNSNVHKHRRRIGVIFQDYKLLPRLNIWENIALPLSIAGKSQKEMEQRVTDLLNLVELADKAFLFPKQLSGGEAQRISIARALSTGPAIIFADEPTGNLDREASIKIGKLIKKINSFGTTVIFATHDHDIMDLFEEARLIHLDKGKVVKDTKKVEAEKDEASNTSTKINVKDDAPNEENAKDNVIKNQDEKSEKSLDSETKKKEAEKKEVKIEKKKSKRKTSKSRRKTKKVKVKAKK